MSPTFTAFYIISEREKKSQSNEGKRVLIEAATLIQYNFKIVR